MENPKVEAVGSEGLLATLVAVKNENDRVSIDIAPSAIYRVLFTLAAVWLVFRIASVILLVVLSLMLVATFNPLVRKLQARMGRSWAIAAVITIIVIVFLGTLALLIPPLLEQGQLLIKNAPLYAEQAQKVLATHHINVNLRREVDQFSSKASSQSSEVMGVFSSVISGVTAFVTVGILTIYLLIEGPQVGMSILRLFPRKDRLSARKLALAIGTQVGGYMRGQMITSAIAGVFCFVTLFVLRVPSAFALGALAAIADAIPLIGLLVALVPAALMALTVSSTTAIITTVVYLVYHQIEDHFIAPKVYGSALGLSLSVIVISILIGVELMGMLGAVLALPVAAAIPSVIAFIQEWQESHSVQDSIEAVKTASDEPT